ncbi:beta-ketoacyl synthase N-terminal-like domain-containing protein [Chitinophaga sp.]|uniref:beta-ketoacyl synthase N-terminal-like domain-containing protein n=1 Tax=Chitinophaga sp. TaxID=1869181 RepID=UPI0031D05614
MSNYSKKDIAVIGMSCRFAGADNIREFWSLIRNGGELIHFYSEEELENMGISQEQIGRPEFIRARSVVTDKTSFDYSFFGYTREEAQLMDPQIRIFHEEVWHALEDAGYDVNRYKGQTGIFAGASEHLNWIAESMIRRMESNVDPFFANIITTKSFLPTLIAYKLNFKGPAYFVNTACSTSLAAIHMACRSLLTKECSMAVAGAVRIDVARTPGYVYQPGMIYSADGHCRTFDVAASGTISGEGAGVVVLKRMEDAIMDKDHIYAIIKASAVNNDGNRKVGYTAPSPEGQAECIRQAHRFAGIAPESISYIEAHGTATQLGDPVEIAALNEAFNFNKEKYCAIGAVKSNMGHLDTAAGVAGFIKTVLSLYHKELPPSLHFNAPNPAIDFNGGPFYVNDTLKKWEGAAEHPLRAGVSAFGIGGTNVHVVLEEMQLTEKVETESATELVLFSARTAEGLGNQVTGLQSLLTAESPAIRNIAFTTQQGRTHFRYRTSVAARSATDLSEQLSVINRDVKAAVHHPEIIFMFPGQGAQYANMGLDLYQQSSVFRKWIDEGCALLETLTGERYIEVLFPPAMTDSRINNTLYTQPLLFVFEYALSQLLAHYGVRPTAMIGHSIGELVAACISGVFTFRDGVRIVLERARRMNEQPEGAMIGVHAPVQEVLPLIRDKKVSIAAINAPANCVISGQEEDIEVVALLLKEKGIGVARLKTSHAFHSDMMSAAAIEFEKGISHIPFSAPQIPIYANLTGEVAGEIHCSPGYWEKHITGTVLFMDGVQTIGTANRDTLWIEVGPGNVLGGFCRQILHESGVRNDVIQLIRHPQEKTDDYKAFLKGIGKIWEGGVDLDWNQLSAGGSRISLPGYVFEKKPFPVEADLETLFTRYMHADKWRKQDINNSFYCRGWKKAAFLSSQVTKNKTHFLLLTGTSELADCIADQLTSDGHLVTTIPAKDLAGGFEQLTVELTLLDSYPEQLIVMADSAGIIDGPEVAFLRLLHLIQSGISTDRGFKKLTLITEGLLSVFGEMNTNDLSLAPITGLLKVLTQEHPSLGCAHLDVEEYGGSLIRRELLQNYHQPVVALRKGFRWVPDYERIDVKGLAPVPLLKMGGHYLIVGGTGKIGMVLAAHLLSNYKATVLLTGRRAPDEIMEKIRLLEPLCISGGSVSYHQLDISRLDALSQFATQYTDRIDGVIHLAGEMSPSGFNPIINLDSQQVHQHFVAKVKGLQNIHSVFSKLQPDFVWIASSLAAILGGLTYGGYAAANSFMDHFVTVRKQELKNWITVNLDGLSFEEGQTGITKAEMIQVFEATLGLTDYPGIVVSVIDLETRLANLEEKKIDNSQSAIPVKGRRREKADATSLTPVEQQLLDAWCTFFGTDDIRIDDSFFELGGDSLKAMTLAGKLNRLFNMQLPVDVFFKHSTIRELSRELTVIIGMQQIQATGNKNENIKELII